MCGIILNSQNKEDLPWRAMLRQHAGNAEFALPVSREERVQMSHHQSLRLAQALCIMWWLPVSQCRSSTTLVTVWKGPMPGVLVWVVLEHTGNRWFADVSSILSAFSPLEMYHFIQRIYSVPVQWPSLSTNGTFQSSKVSRSSARVDTTSGKRGVIMQS